MRAVLGALLLPLLVPAARAQDVVELEGGKRHEGLVVCADDETVVLRAGGARGGRDRSFDRGDLAALETREQALRELLA